MTPFTSGGSTFPAVIAQRIWTKLNKGHWYVKKLL